MNDKAFVAAARSAIELNPRITRDELHEALVPDEPLPEAQAMYMVAYLHGLHAALADNTTLEVIH